MSPNGGYHLSLHPRAFSDGGSYGLCREAQDHAAEIKLRAERKAGEMLKQLERGKTGPQIVVPGGGRNSEYQNTLVEIDTSKGQANRWQAVASLPQEVFDEEVEAAKSDTDRELTTALMVRRSRAHTAQTFAFNPTDDGSARNARGATGPRTDRAGEAQRFR